MTRLTGEQCALAEKHLPLADGLAFKHARHSGCDEDEACGIARLALVEASQRFDPARGVQFHSYAWLRICGALIDDQRKPYCRPQMVVQLKPALRVADRALSPEATAIISDIWNAVDELPRREATAIRLRFQHGYKGREIATLFDIHESRVSQLIRRGCDKLLPVA